MFQNPAKPLARKARFSSSGNNIKYGLEQVAEAIRDDTSVGCRNLPHQLQMACPR